MSTNDTLIIPGKLSEWDNDGSDYEYEAELNDTRYRVRIMPDYFPAPPDGDCYSTVFSVDYRYGRNAVRVALSGHDDFLLGALDHYVGERGVFDGIDLFTRYVRAFYAGAVEEVESSYTQGAPLSVSVVTSDTWINKWGNDQASEVNAKNDDWQAYIDGDVYGIVVERLSSSGEEWEACKDSECWGLYGDDWAVESAVTSLTTAIYRDASL